MAVPVVMAYMSLALNYPNDRWLNIIVATLIFAFTLIGLPTYTSYYAKFLIVVGLVFNVFTVWIAWKWV